LPAITYSQLAKAGPENAGERNKQANAARKPRRAASRKSRAGESVKQRQLKEHTFVAPVDLHSFYIFQFVVKTQKLRGGMV
jgi:hypothetical protein